MALAPRLARLNGYRCRLATVTPKQGAKVRRKPSRNSTPCEPAGWRGQESLKWCGFALFPCMGLPIETP
jgi:hypothetical protein